MICWVWRITSPSIFARAVVSAGWIGVRPITSRSELSATAFTSVSGLRTLNR